MFVFDERHIINLRTIEFMNEFFYTLENQDFTLTA